MREVSLLGYCRVLPTPYGWVDWIICCLLTSSTVLDCLLYVLVKVWPPNVASEYAFHLDHTDETHITAPWWVLSSLLRWGWARGELLLPAIPTVQPLEHEKVSGLYGSTFSSLVLWQIRPRPQIYDDICYFLTGLSSGPVLMSFNLFCFLNIFIPFKVFFSDNFSPQFSCCCFFLFLHSFLNTHLDLMIKNT